MKIAVCQTKPVLMDLKANIDDVLEHIHAYKKKGADLIVFPELALTGYFVGLDYHNVALRMDSNEIQKLAAATKGTAAIIGFIEESQSMNFYNAALVAVNGECLFTYRKIYLPNYGVFEERKFFSAGKRIRVFKLQDFNIAVFICNDLWHPSLPYLGVTEKADMFISIFNSSQGSMGTEFSNIESWKIINKFYSRIFGIYNICANRVGEERPEDKRQRSKDKKTKDEVLENFLMPDIDKTYRFWGSSSIINPFGQEIYKAKAYEPDVIMGGVSKDIIRRKKILLPYLRDDDPFFTHRELNRILFQKTSTE
jgi:predicted amidohydrolase